MTLDVNMQLKEDGGQNHQKSDNLDTVDAKVQANADNLKPMRTIKLVLDVLEQDPGIRKRYVDQAILSMLQDATNGETEPVMMVNKRLFRPEESAPLVDSIRIDKPFVIRLLGNKA